MCRASCSCRSLSSLLSLSTVVLAISAALTLCLKASAVFTIPTLELLLVKELRPVSHQIPIGILLPQPPCVPIYQPLGTLGRHFARVSGPETTSEIKNFLSNAWVNEQCLHFKWTSHSQHRKSKGNAHSYYISLEYYTSYALVCFPQ